MLPKPRHNPEDSEGLNRRLFIVRDRNCHNSVGCHGDSGDGLGRNIRQMAIQEFARPKLCPTARLHDAPLVRKLMEHREEVKRFLR